MNDLCEVCEDEDGEFLCDRCNKLLCEGCSYSAPNGETCCAECMTDTELGL